MVTITDLRRYEIYQRAFLPMLKRFGGRLLVADDRPQVREGHWPHQKLVIIEFVDEAAFERWETSDEYQRIAQDRRAGALAVLLVARGVGH